ncbi:MAG: hypothetical protein JW717_14615 [Marinilabiliaceae bacterium]|jgi:hypothetical protein|nr:hypothetical protein [Marinilabiliaceae bacterium]
MKNLELMGVQEMTSVEKIEINGGFPIIAVGIALAIGLIGGYLFGKELSERME